MDVYSPKTKQLDEVEKGNVLGRYLTMTNRLSLTYFKGEITGVKQEKDDA